MAAYRDRNIGPVWPALVTLAAGVLYVVALGIVLWRLWTEVLHAWPT